MGGPWIASTTVQWSRQLRTSQNAYFLHPIWAYRKGYLEVATSGCLDEFTIKHMVEVATSGCLDEFHTVKPMVEVATSQTGESSFVSKAWPWTEQRRPEDFWLWRACVPSVSDGGSGGVSERV